MKFFHRHKFDPEKWKLVSAIQTARTPYVGAVKIGEPILTGVDHTYSNTCLECGDLIFRWVSELSNENR